MSDLSEKMGEIYDKINEPEEIEEVEEIEAPLDDPKEEPKEIKEEIQEAEEPSEIPEEEPEKEASAGEPPAHWSGQAKPLWNKLPPLARAEVLRQEGVINKLRSQHAQERNQYAEIDSVLDKHRNILRATYGSEKAGLEQLFALSDFATKDPYGFVQYFSQQRGLDLRSLNQAGQQQLDPNVTALQKQIQNLNNEINGFKQQNEQAVEKFVEGSYQEFMSNPDNKYVEDVKDDMAFFLESGRASDYQSAYNMAVKINPVVSELLQAEQTQQVKDTVVQETSQAAQKAKKAKAQNVATKAVASVESSQKSDWRDTLRETGAQMLG